MKKTAKKAATKVANKRAKVNYLGLMIANLNSMMDLNGMKARTNKALSSARYRNAEYWFCKGFICSMPDSSEKTFINEFVGMLNMSGRSILTMKQG